MWRGWFRRRAEVTRHVKTSAFLSQGLASVETHRGTFNDRPARIIARDMRLQEREVAHIAAEGDVECVTDDWNRADNSVDSRIRYHARHRPARYAELARFPNDISGNGIGYEVASNGNEPPR